MKIKPNQKKALETILDLSKTIKTEEEKEFSRLEQIFENTRKNTNPFEQAINHKAKRANLAQKNFQKIQVAFNDFNRNRNGVRPALPEETGA